MAVAREQTSIQTTDVKIMVCASTTKNEEGKKFKPSRLPMRSETKRGVQKVYFFRSVPQCDRIAWMKVCIIAKNV